ncbi:FkbM family methyltransferase [Vitiosangium sp. GDMCC 1.1324]|uniref:FkbM family methyltransferase n=1 Tax=Vitiosangium sp. (strain GDMCC 1.1324) TaxID=2138576 RepID=UPI000D363A50|nr:FkbM family methyltransferase [Vitiosangium sp. GDMCC 1.1324]PTL76386.1 FkbM family methyltransferase [Vitiosangium sp. GDMCC 1.1324]
MPTLSQRLNKPEYLFRPQQLLQRLRALNASSSERERTFSLPWGLPIIVDPQDTIGRAVWHLGLYDLLVSETLWRLVSPGEQVLDVGANIGHMASVMAMRTGPSGQVIAFEPHPLLHARLQRNLELWRAKLPGLRLEARAVAVGDANRPGHLSIPTSFQENAGTASLVEAGSASVTPGTPGLVAVDVRTLDSELPASLTPLVMKIDVEGGEAAAFRGATRLLSTCVRDIVFEDHGAWPTPPMQLLRDAGYTLFRLEKTLRGPALVPPETPPETGAWEAPSFLATRQPDRARALLAPRGWRCLTPPRA